MSLFLAVDGGNSKTEVLLADTAGAVLGYAKGPGSNHQGVGMGTAMSRVDGLVAQARARAGIAADARPALAACYLAGADFPVELTALAAALADTGIADKAIVDNDTFALLRAGIEAPDTDAVAVICGAGINCVGRSANGATARFPALGALTGDWGGGEHLGAMMLWHAARAEDGRGPPTALVDVVTRHFGRSRIEDVSAAVHFGEIAREHLAELTPALFALAAGDDAVARFLVVQQGEEIVTLATTALRRLDLHTVPVAVVLGGGVLRARDPILYGVITERLRDGAPRAELVLVTDPPVLGAGFLALDALGAERPAHDRLRAEVRRIVG